MPKPLQQDAARSREFIPMYDDDDVLVSTLLDGVFPFRE
ncbi:hypothetical protein GWI33_014424, partial [Rhynchophorus ferrugineus]